MLFFGSFFLGEMICRLVRSSHSDDQSVLKTVASSGIAVSLPGPYDNTEFRFQSVIPPSSSSNKVFEDVGYGPVYDLLHGRNSKCFLLIVCLQFLVHFTNNLFFKVYLSRMTLQE